MSFSCFAESLVEDTLFLLWDVNWQWLRPVAKTSADPLHGMAGQYCICSVVISCGHMTPQGVCFHRVSPYSPWGNWKPHFLLDWLLFFCFCGLMTEIAMNFTWLTLSVTKFVSSQATPCHLYGKHVDIDTNVIQPVVEEGWSTSGKHLWRWIKFSSLHGMVFFHECGWMVRMTEEPAPPQLLTVHGSFCSCLVWEGTNSNRENRKLLWSAEYCSGQGVPPWSPRSCTIQPVTKKI